MLIVHIVFGIPKLKWLHGMANGMSYGPSIFRNTDYFRSMFSRTSIAEHWFYHNNMLVMSFSELE